jgi:tetratricopeptide (TPR) repeat protein
MKNKFIVPVVVVLFGAIGFLSLSKLIHFETEPSIQHSSPFDRPNTEKRIKEHAETLRRIDNRWDYIHSAEKLAKQGKYDDAIVEAKQSLKYTNPNDASAWVSRQTLQRLYEKAGYYDLAMKELEWAESVQTRPDVLKKLAEDRNRLEKLLHENDSSLPLAAE